MMGALRPCGLAVEKMMVIALMGKTKKEQVDCDVIKNMVGNKMPILNRSQADMAELLTYPGSVRKNQSSSEGWGLPLLVRGVISPCASSQAPSFHPAYCIRISFC